MTRRSGSGSSLTSVEQGSLTSYTQGRGTSPALPSLSSEAVVRRIIKPFAVEVRSATRRTRLEAPITPVWPDLAEQPVIEWPDALMPPAAVPEPVPPRPVRHVRPTEAEAVFSAPAEPYRDPRKPPPVLVAKPDGTTMVEPERVAHAATSKAPADKPEGRIWPVIEPEVRSFAADVTAVKPAERPRRAKPVQATDQTADPPLMVMPSAIDAAAVAATLLLRQSGNRLTRDDFKRGERWKARLPASVHRAKRR